MPTDRRQEVSEAAIEAVDELVQIWQLPEDEAAFRRALADAWLAGRSAAFLEAMEIVGVRRAD